MLSPYPSLRDDLLRAIGERVRRLRQRHATLIERDALVEHAAIDRAAEHDPTRAQATAVRVSHRRRCRRRRPSRATAFRRRRARRRADRRRAAPPTTASAEAGRCGGIGARQRMIARSISGSRSRTMAVGGVISRLLALGDQLREVAAFERALAGEELVEHEAERVDVAARRDLAAGELLGRHVGGRAGAQRSRRSRPRGRSR